MSITFVSSRRQILICDFEFGKIEPSMGKIRRSLVVSPRSYNRRHGFGPGRCVVIPFTATPPEEHILPSHIHFPLGGYPSLKEEFWAICECIRSVSHARLDRVNVGGVYISELISEEDMGRVELGIRHAAGLV
jgi:uncharacterized protein YifN (PemK superfamily)